MQFLHSGMRRPVPFSLAQEVRMKKFVFVVLVHCFILSRHKNGLHFQFADEVHSRNVRILDDLNVDLIRSEAKTFTHVLDRIPV